MLKRGERPGSVKKELNSGLRNNGVSAKMSMLKKRSIFVVYELSRRRQFSLVDLHHLILDEADQVVYLIFEEIRKMKREALVNGTVKIGIIVGKGNHSRNGPILLPHFMNMLKRNGYKMFYDNAGKIDCWV